MHPRDIVTLFKFKFFKQLKIYFLLVVSHFFGLLFIYNCCKYLISPKIERKFYF